MSVLFLPPSAGAASVPDASETVSGKIRIATSAEATTGTNDLTAMTPAKVKTVVDAAVVGGVTYKGTFDTSAPVDLSNALQGDLYIISVAGSYQGQTWAVGDHLLINADMGGTLDPAKIDKVDNTDAVTSVAGRTGAVVLSSADISGLATVAASGAYSDLSGTPTLATVATTGAYSDLSGTPTLATVATTGAYSDLSGTPDVPDFQTITVSTNTTLSSSLEDGCYLIVFTANATVTIPAYTTGKNLVFRFANFGVGACTIQQASGGTRLYEFGDYGVTGVNSVTISSGVTRTFHLWAVGSTVGLNYWTEANPSTSGGVSTLGALTDVDVTGAVDTNVLKYNSTSGDWEDGAVAYSEVTGTPTLATVATTGAYSDLSGTPTLGTAAAEDVGTAAGNVVQLNGSAQLPAVDGSLLTNVSASVAALDDIGDVTITGVANTQVIRYNSTSGEWENGAVAYADVTGTPTLGTAAAEDVGTSANNVVQLNGSAQLPAVDGSLLTNVSASVAALDDVGDVTITGVTNTQVIKYNGTSGDWENGAVAYSEVTGTPTLATVATSGAYSDLTGTPTLGTAAAEDVGTSANNVVQLDGSARLPAVDGSQLINLPSGASTLGALTDVTITTPANGQALIYNGGTWANGTVGATVALNTANPSTSPYNITSSTSFLETWIFNPSVTLTVNIPAPSAAGSGYRYNIKNISTQTITIIPGSGSIDGAGSVVINVQYASVTLVSDGANWFIV